jgi:hypothetical protein
MATSPNYGWSEPDNTSLVKNGAQAMRTLGDAIDASVWNIGFGQAGKNKIINGNFGIWQRGTSLTPGNSAYTADRWAYFGQNSTNFTVERVATGDTTNLPFIQYAARLKRASGATSTNQQYLIQSFESANSIPFAGRTVTYSFYARAGANYSAASNALFAYIATGTGTDQNALSGYTGSATPISTTVTLTTTWQRFTVTGTLAATTTELATAFIYTPSGTAGANDYFEVTGVQLEAGSKATPFQTASGGSPQAELAMCQRYYVRFGSSTYGFTGLCPSGYLQSTTLAVAFVPLPVQMRVIPTSTDYSNLQVLDSSIASYTPSAAVVSAWSSPTLGALDLTISGGTAARFATVRQSATTGYLGFSAEL